MPSYIVKLTDAEDRAYYLEWSTIVDAPVTYGMSLDQFRTYYAAEYGRHAMRDLENRLLRVEAKGTSSRLHDSAEDTINWNFCGANDSRLSADQILDYYCIRQGEGEKPEGRPNWQTLHQMGADAFRAGIEEPPYHLRPSEVDDWREGWQDAADYAAQRKEAA